MSLVRHHSSEWFVSLNDFPSRSSSRHASALTSAPIDFTEVTQKYTTKNLELFLTATPGDIVCDSRLLQ